MRLHVVGTLRNKLNIKSIIGYYLWDVESNELKLVGTKDLKRVMCQLDVDFSNITISEPNEFGVIRGNKYSLDKLTHIQDGNGISNILDKYTVMDSYEDNTFLLARFDGTNVDYKLCLMEQMYFMVDSVWNYDLKSNTLYPKANIKSTDLKCKLRIDEKRHNDAVKQLNIVNEQSTNRKEYLLEQAYNKDIVWSIEDFKEFMKLMGWTYSLVRADSYKDMPDKLYEETKHCSVFYELNYVDKNCEVLHMPIGVSYCKKLFNEKPKNLNTLIISSTVDGIETLYDINTNTQQIQGHDYLLGNGVVCNVKCDIIDGIELGYEKRQEIKQMQIEPLEIHNIYRQTCSKELEQWLRYSKRNFNGLCMLNITGELEFNTKDIQLLRAFNLCTFNEIPYIECLKVNNCFCNIEANNQRLELNVKNIEDSFKKMNLKDNAVIIFGENTRSINYSFIDCKFKEVDFSRAIEVSSISSSFKGVSNLEVFDISNIQTKMDRLTNSLGLCTKLHTILLPKAIRTIGNANADRSSLVKEVVLPEDIDCIYGGCFTSGSCKVIYPKKVTELSRNYLVSFRNANTFEPVYQNKITKLTTSLTGAYGKLSELKLPNTLESLPDEVFSTSSLSEYDSRLLPNVTDIPIRAFKESKIQSLILADNIITIGEEFLNQCDYIRTIILGKNINQMPSIVLKDCNPSALVKVYVVKNSYASKRLRKSNKMIVIEVNSVDEAIEREYGEVTPEKKQSKFEIMLKGTDYESLLNKHCIGNISYLYPLFKSLADDEEYLQNKIELNTNKFKDMSIESLSNLSKRLKYLRDNVELSKNTNKDNTKRFISLCNLVTTLSNNCDELFENINFDNIDITYLDTLAYVDNKNAILLIKFKKDKKVVVLLGIIYNNRIVYLTQFWSQQYVKTIPTNSKITLFNTEYNINHSVKYTNIGMGTILISGDRLENKYSTPPDSCVHGFRIPNDFVNIIEDNIRDTAKVVGILNFERKSKQKKQFEVKYDVLLYDLINSKFIECVATLDFSDDDNEKVSRVNIRSVKCIYDLSDINKIDKEYFEWLLNGFNNRLSNNILKSMILSDSDIQKIKTDMNNYDLDGDTSITYISELIYQNKIDTVDKLLQNKSMIQRLLDSHMYDNANISMNYLKKNSNVYQNILMKSVINSDNILMEYAAKLKDGNNIYITGLADGTTTMSSKKFLKGGYIKLQRMLNMLNSIGAYRESYNGKHKPYIDNERINTDSFYYVLSKSLKMYRIHGIKLHLAIDLYNADTYLIGDVWDTDFYKLFRAKSYQLGLRLFKTFTDENQEHMQSSLITILNYIHSNTPCRPSDGIQQLREDILNGLPNNIPYTGTMLAFADILAKQPII